MNIPSKKKLTIPDGLWQSAKAQPYVMKLADDLSNDPMIASLLGPNFKVIVDYDAKARRITYSFRHPDDISEDDTQAKKV